MHRGDGRRKATCMIDSFSMREAWETDSPTREPLGELHPKLYLSLRITMRPVLRISIQDLTRLLQIGFDGK
jgi:hypothetical protein